jgi:hypothetical protein
MSPDKNVCATFALNTLRRKPPLDGKRGLA